jgi:hypothetical protein
MSLRLEISSFTKLLTLPEILEAFRPLLVQLVIFHQVGRTIVIHFLVPEF